MVTGLVLAICCIAADDQTKGVERRYEDGPVKAEYYRAAPPKSRRTLAQSFVGIRHKTAYYFDREGRSIIVRTSKMEVFAVFVPDRSWNVTPNDQRLIDHEQGHFDLMQIGALQARIALKKELSTLVGRGESKQTAVKDLERRTSEFLARFDVKALDENRIYDRDTRHGLRRSRQAEHRAEQKKRLAELTEKFKPKPKPAKKAGG
ncbi:MAG: hypothetical protein QGG36_15240 [Pirellulaceae bacterium]|jgi:hypothetical protein|nr:hypothetical protein [Pirellulaceae bacterium]MDP7017158.1 hypothetical protein [Pirellulaceae bacterium]